MLCAVCGLWCPPASSWVGAHGLRFVLCAVCCVCGVGSLVWCVVVLWLCVVWCGVVVVCCAVLCCVLCVCVCVCVPLCCVLWFKVWVLGFRGLRFQV